MGGLGEGERLPVGVPAPLGSSRWMIFWPSGMPFGFLPLLPTGVFCCLGACELIGPAR